MKVYLIIFCMAFSLTTLAGVPLLQYSWHNQLKSSQLMVFEDGSIVHQERAQYQSRTIQEEKLTPGELLNFKKMITEILKNKSTSDRVEIALDSFTGTIELRADNGLKIVEGIIKDSTDLRKARSFRSEALETDDLKAFIFKYTDADMEF